MGNFLVIGYGNDLRGDDGVGRCIAEEVASWRLRGVTVRSLHQLVPELVEDLRRAGQVLFVDATASAGEVCLRDIAEEPRAKP